jgi:glyoxylase-like metal-dependent hydrolase (beta-lactamase superfamily II)
MTLKPDMVPTFQVGEIRCTLLNDGLYDYPSNLIFSNVPVEERDKELQARHEPTGHVTSPFSCLLVDTGRNKVLIDTGIGNVPTAGNLMRQLAAAGLQPADVDTVVLTHAHPDHIGGVLDGNGDPAFPNARYVMNKTEWDFWTSDLIDITCMSIPDEMKSYLISTARTNLPPLEDCIDLLEKDSEIVPGVHSYAAPGHTVGHMAVFISSGSDTLLHLVDTVLHPILLENPSWQTAFDLNHDRSAVSRRALADLAAADRLPIIAYHFPFPGFGHLTRLGSDQWRFEPAPPQ